MPGVVRNIDLCSGHDCWPPRLPITYSPDVFVNNVPVERMTDVLDIHCCPNVGCHPGLYLEANTVYANTLPIQKHGDPIDCGSSCMDHSGDVSIMG